MTLAAVTATPGQRGFDCVTRLTPQSASALKAAGMAYVVRYLASLTPAEIEAITGAGLLLSCVCYSRAPGWVPTTELGQSDGANAARLAHALSIPAGVTLWCDLEGYEGGDPVGYVNAWATVVASGNYQPGLYVGYADHPLTPAQLYALAVVRYWHSCSIVPTVADRGYCMVQSAPNSWVAGVQVDVDVVQADAKGDVPAFCGSAAVVG